MVRLLLSDSANECEEGYYSYHQAAPVLTICIYTNKHTTTKLILCMNASSI